MNLQRLIDLRVNNILSSEEIKEILIAEIKMEENTKIKAMEENTKIKAMEENTKIKAMEENTKIKIMEEKTKQIQIKYQNLGDDSNSNAKFYNKQLIHKVDHPNWLDKTNQSIQNIFSSYLTENELHNMLMPFFNKICTSSPHVAYDVRNNPTLGEDKPDVIFVPYQFSLQPNPKWDALTSNGGLELLIQAVIEIKKGKITDGHKGQAIFYLHKLLHLNPERINALGALTNGEVIVFFKTTRTNTGYETYETETIPFINFQSQTHSSEGVQYLLDMVKNKISTHIPLPNSKLVLNRFLGKGATSLVYETTNNSAFKICSAQKHSAAFEIEKTRLMDLNQLLPNELQAHVPQLLGTGLNYLKLPLFKKPNLEHISITDLMPIVDLLEQVHKLGYCHRDIRPENIVLNNTRLVLIDWGFSGRISDELVYFFGTASFCAAEYGRNQLENIPCRFKPEYDIESLFKTILYFQNETIRKELKTIQTYQLLDRIKAAIDIWGKHKDMFPKEWSFDSVKQKLNEMQDFEMTEQY